MKYFGTSSKDQVIYRVDGKEYRVWKNKPDQVICFLREDGAFRVSTNYYHLTTGEEIIQAIRDSF